MNLLDALKKASRHNNVLTLDGTEFVYISNKYPLVFRDDATKMFNPTPEQIMSCKWEIKASH